MWKQRRDHCTEDQNRHFQDSNHKEIAIPNVWQTLGSQGALKITS